MSRFEDGLSRWNFKKIAKVYIIVLVIAIIGCCAVAGYVYRDRISFALQYSRVSDAIEKADSSSVQSELDKLASSSSDVVDILMLDSDNQVVYSAKGSEFSRGQLNLTKAGDDKDYLVSEADSGVVFKYVNGDEFLLDSVFNTDFGEVEHEYRDSSFYESGSADMTVYMLSFLDARGAGDKIYIISSPTTVAGGAVTLKVIAAVVVLLFMVYWVLLALWAYSNASKSKLNGFLWGIVVLLTNIAGVLVYEIYKHANATCPACGASQSRLHLYCTNCGQKLGRTCEVCGAQIGRKDLHCSRCGTPVAQESDAGVEQGVE